MSDTYRRCPRVRVSRAGPVALQVSGVGPIPAMSPLAFSVKTVTLLVSWSAVYSRVPAGFTPAARCWPGGRGPAGRSLRCCRWRSGKDRHVVGVVISHIQASPQRWTATPQGSTRRERIDARCRGSPVALSSSADTSLLFSLPVTRPSRRTAWGRRSRRRVVGVGSPLDRAPNSLARSRSRGYRPRSRRRVRRIAAVRLPEVLPPDAIVADIDDAVVVDVSEHRRLSPRARLPLDVAWVAASPGPPHSAAQWGRSRRAARPAEPAALKARAAEAANDTATSQSCGKAIS